jgi:hypothetical protein
MTITLLSWCHSSAEMANRTDQEMRILNAMSMRVIPTSGGGAKPIVSLLGSNLKYICQSLLANLVDMLKSKLDKLKC